MALSAALVKSDSAQAVLRWGFNSSTVLLEYLYPADSVLHPSFPTFGPLGPPTLRLEIMHARNFRRRLKFGDGDGVGVGVGVDTLP
jgi:hypothetical protein